MKACHDAITGKAQSRMPERSLRLQPARSEFWTKRGISETMVQPECTEREKGLGRLKSFRQTVSQQDVERSISCIVQIADVHHDLVLRDECRTVEGL